MKPDIRQILQWSKHKNFNFEPGYQRKGGVWSTKDREFLIDTIIHDKPMPEFFLHKRNISNGRFVYDVVDGKQRLLAIISYSKNNFAAKIEDIGEDKKKIKFSELKKLGRENDFYNYKLRIYEIEDLDFSKVIDIFIRLNSTGAKLNKQEVRNAKFRGDFIKLAVSLCEKTSATKNYFRKNKIFSERSLMRMADVEFACELLAYIVHGPQDKKKALDGIIGLGEKMNDKPKRRGEYIRVINLIKAILPSIAETRFIKKSDFYSLFSVIYKLWSDSYNLENPRYQKIIRLILINFSNTVDNHTIKKSKNDDIEDYHLSVIEGPDSRTNREIRFNILFNLISSVVECKDNKRLFSPEQKRLLWNTSRDKKCAICKKAITSWSDLNIDHKNPWSLRGPTDLRNGRLTHRKCNIKRGQGKKR